jgi:formate dehydrogenase alpha subunit
VSAGATARIDGRDVEPREGETILDAATRVGVEIPALCYTPGSPPEGGCRLCIVETDPAARPQAACHTPLREGMEVRTSTPRIDALRRALLDLLLSAHPRGAFDGRASGSELGRLMRRYGIAASSFGHHGEPSPLDESHPYLRFERSLCITCRRCLHACEDVQGQFVYGVEGRGAAARLVFGPGESFAESPCTACGACVEVCPTGAITDRDRLERSAAARTTRSTCGYCGVGCTVEIESSDSRVLRIRGAPDAPANRGHLCAKGRYAHAYHRSADRLRRPLLRVDGRLEAVSWEEAIRFLASRLRELRDTHGPDSLGVFTSSRSTNEAAYLLQKLFRTAIGTNNVDCCARVCHSSTALALRTVTGTGAASASYADIERARSIVVAGANPTEAHPVIGARIKQAARRGAVLLVIDPRRIELVDYARLHLPLRAGTNVALFNAMAKVCLEEGLVDRAYVEERTEGIAELERFLGALSLDGQAALCGLEAESIRRAARILGAAGPTLFVIGLGLSELTQGTASVMTLCNLAMLTGSIGRPGAGILPLRGQNNVQGNADMGSVPHSLTGYQRLDDPAVRERARRVWGVEPPERAGLTIPEMIDAACRGQIRGLWIQGEDVAQSDPNERRVVEALERLDLLVVQEMFLSETARYAHLVLPACGALEQEGTFTSAERRIQRVRAAVAPPGEARPDWEVVRDVARAIGEPWRYDDPSDVWEEIARIAPQLFGGVSYARLGARGLQWPCPSPDHPGTETVHAEGFLRGRGRLVAVDFQPSPEHDVPGYPHLLITGRVLHHYNVGTMTRRTPAATLVPGDFLEVHPEDALARGLRDGDVVVVESRWGACRAPVRLSERVARGTLFLSFHFPETHTNRVTGPQLDPESKCPEYKVTAVRLVSQGHSA